MPDPLDYLNKKNHQLEEQFQNQYPEVFEVIQQNNLLKNGQNSAQVPESDSPISTEKTTISPEKKLFAQFTLEEHQSIMQKMQDIVKLPAGQLDTEFELYLEQQLSDMLGFSVSAEVKGQRLTHSTGTFSSLPHYKRYPTDTIGDHAAVLEAGFSNKRSLFGWLNSAVPNNESAQWEKFGISLPFSMIPSWSENQTEKKNWYKYRKLVVVNPIESRAVVATITDIFTPSTSKYQFGGTPELIREGKFWSPASAGKALVFFIEEDENISLGPINLEYTQ